MAFGEWNGDLFPLSGQHVFDHKVQQVAAVARSPHNLDLFVNGFDNKVYTTSGWIRQREARRRLEARWNSDGVRYRKSAFHSDPQSVRAASTVHTKETSGMDPSNCSTMTSRCI